jgi:hypothetical protein
VSAEFNTEASGDLTAERFPENVHRERPETRRAVPPLLQSPIERLCLAATVVAAASVSVLGVLALRPTADSDMAILQTDVLDYAKEQRLLPGLESSLSYIPERGRLSRHAETAQAIDYMLKRWAAFTRFLDDGRICLTNNAAERALRGIALGRRARLFAGSDRGGERAAAMYTLIATAQLNDINPQA